LYQSGKPAAGFVPKAEIAPEKLYKPRGAVVKTMGQFGQIGQNPAIHGKSRDIAAPSGRRSALSAESSRKNHGKCAESG
jgi:hypothetical protein